MYLYLSFIPILYRNRFSHIHGILEIQIQDKQFYSINFNSLPVHYSMNPLGYGTQTFTVTLTVTDALWMYWYCNCNV